MNCPSCGSEHPPTRKFCGVCGQALRQPVASGPEFGTAAVPPPSYAMPGSAPAYASAPVATREQSPAMDKGIFIVAFQHALAWKPLSLVALGVLGIIVIVMLMTLVSGLVVASTIRAGSFQSAGTATVFLSIATIATVYTTAMVFLAATTKMCYERVITGNKLGRRDSLRFALGNLGSVLLTPILLGLIVSAVVIGEMILFAAGRIDFIGPIVTGALFAPLIVINAALFLLLNYGVWLMLISVAAGTVGVADTFGTTWRLMRTSYKTMIPELLSITLVQLVIVFVGGLLFVVASSITTSLAALGGMGGLGFETIMRGGFDRLAEQLLNSSYGRYGRSSDEGALIGMIAMGAGMTFLMGLALAFPLVFFVNGCVRVHQRASAHVSSTRQS